MISVTTPASNTRLTTVDAVRSQYGITAARAADGVLEGLIDRASGMVVAYCGRPFATQVYKQTEFPTQSVLSIPLRPPARAITVVEGGVTLSPTDDYLFDDELSVVRRSCNTGYRRFWSPTPITITYTAGYVLPEDDGDRTLPHDVEQAALYLVGDLWKVQSRQDASTLKREKIDGVGEIDYYTISMTSAMINPAAEMLLAPYRSAEF